MEPDIAIFKDEEHFKSVMADSKKATDLKVVCPKCKSVHITCFMCVPYRYAIKRIVKEETATAEGILVLLGEEELDYDEEFDMFRCQECEAEWRNEIIDGDFVRGTDRFEEAILGNEANENEK